MPVTRVTVHHEGAGTPTDVPRGAEGGYTYWIGPTKWARLRSVSSSFATKYFNHVSVDVVLSGDRTNIDVTDAEIRMIGECVADARSRGEVVDHPNVYPHNASFQTACPGNDTLARFTAISFACQKPQPPSAPPIDWVALKRLDNWRKRVTAEPLELGDRGPDVLILNELLKAKRFMRRWTKVGDAFGKTTQDSLYRMKKQTQLGNTIGYVFGGDAADALLAV